MLKSLIFMFLSVDVFAQVYPGPMWSRSGNTLSPTYPGDNVTVGTTVLDATGGAGSLTASFSNSGSALISASSCGLASRASGPIKSLTLYSDGSIGNASVDITVQTFAQWLAGGSTGLAGTVIGTPTFAAAKFGNGLSGAGASNYVALPSGVWGYQSTDSWTIEAWLKTSVAGQQVAISGGASPAWIGVDTGHLATGLAGASGGFSSIVRGAATISDNAWHHVAVVVTAGTVMTFWVDGVLDGSFTGTLASQATGIGSIGNFEPTANVQWNGTIDEVAFWNTNKYTVPFSPPVAAYTGLESNLRVLYHLDSGGVPAIPVSMSNGTPVSFTASRGIQKTTFAGWVSTVVTAGNMYCFNLTAPAAIVGLTALVTY